MSRAIVVAAGVGVSLASCGSRIPPPEPGVAVAADALPRPAPGLWGWDSEAGGRKQLCLSGKVLTALASRPGCPATRQVRTASGAYVVETRCQAGQGVRTWAKASGDFSRAFTVDVVIDDGRGGVSDHAAFRYLGPCPAGRRPDDAA